MKDFPEEKSLDDFYGYIGKCFIGNSVYPNGAVFVMILDVRPSQNIGYLLMRFLDHLGQTNMSTQPITFFDRREFF